MYGRRRRVRRVAERQRDRWIFSFTEIILVLLALFITLAAQQMHASRAPAAPQPREAEVHESAASSLPSIQDALRQRGIESVLEPRGLVIHLSQGVLFPSGNDELAPDAMEIIDRIAGAIRAVPNKIQLAGYSDSLPIHGGRFRNNWDLSAARGLRLFEILTQRYGIPEDRLAVVGYGSMQPRASNETPDGRAENRRVEIVISAEPSE